MLPSGRRRPGALSPLTICLAALLLFVSSVRAAVLGIDFGTLNIKAAIVKPGIPLDIVLTKDSKRKEVAAVAFKPNRDAKNNIIAELGTFPERAYGSDALALQGRFPSEVFPNLKFLLGAQWGDEASNKAAVYKQRYPGVQLQQDQELGTTAFKSSAFAAEVPPFSVEELIGMQLANIKRNAQAMAGQGSSVNDAVITIPPFYTADERRAIIRAANFAGLEVMSLISDGLAVGLDYAKSRSFPEVTKGETPEYHMVFDMGAGSATATVMRFQSRTVKDTGRYNKTVQEVQVIGTGWDSTLGGDALTHLIVDDFVQKLLTKPALKSRGTTEDEIRQNGRLMSRFFKDAERARQVLSANTETSASFEEILPDIDFRVKLTRAEFEKLADGFADRVATPIEDALKMAQLTTNDLKSVILHGGAIRTPFVQSKLEAVVDDEAKLRSNVNPDESAVFGAAFKAASLSASFKVKEIRASDVAGYATALVYTDKGQERKQALFGPNALVGPGSTTKQVSFKDREDFSFRFVQNIGGTDRGIVKIQAENLTASVQELINRPGCDKDTIGTKFNVRLDAYSGFPDVVSAGVSCEVDEAAKPGSIGDSVKGWLGFGKKEQQPLGEEDEDDGPVEQVDATSSATSTEGSATSSSGTASGSKAAETPKKQIETIPLKLSVSSEGNPQASQDTLQAMVDRLIEFDKSDQARMARDEAQNVLESYTYFVRDFLSNKDYEAASTKDERDSISSTLQATRDWMESGELIKATTEVLKEKRKALKDLVEPIQKRRTEGIDRPKAVKALYKALDALNKGTLKIESDSAKAAKSIASAASAASASGSSVLSEATDSASSIASEATDSASSIADEATDSASSIASEATAASDADDLEESTPTEASSTRETAAPIPTNPYDSIDLDSVKETYQDTYQWLKDRLADQEKLKPYEDPVLLAKDIQKKVDELKRTLNSVVTKAASAAVKTSTKKPQSTKTKSSKKSKATKDSTEEAQEPVPAQDASAEEAADKKPVTGGEAANEKPITGEETMEDMMRRVRNRKPGGSESMDDMLKRMQDQKKARGDDKGHEEL